MAYCNVDLPDDTDGAALLAVIYSDQVAEGMEAAVSAEEAEALLAEKSEEELMALLKARWEDMMEDAGETPEEAKELFRTIKAGDYSRYMSEVR